MVLHTQSGITPALAGKRHFFFRFIRFIGDHPRTRGEKGNLPFDSMTGTGSPPHSRGKEYQMQCHHYMAGITPALAGKSS